MATSTALRDVSLPDSPPACSACSAPNGAGKSSLMRTIATLAGSRLRHHRLRRHRRVDANKSAVRRMLGYLPQDFGVYPKVSALGLLDHLAVLKGYLNRSERADVVEALLRQVNLWDVRKRKLGTFSGACASASASRRRCSANPKLVIVDEPTAGLDPEERNRFLNLLADIGSQVVRSSPTHIVEDVTDLCPRMAMICRQASSSDERRAARSHRGHARPRCGASWRPSRRCRNTSSATPCSRLA